MDEVEVHLRIATTGPNKKYPDVRLSVAVLEQLAERVRAGKFPMQIEHDLRRPVDGRFVDAVVVPHEDGHALEAVVAMSPAELVRVRRLFGEPDQIGISFSMSEPQVAQAGAGVSLSADAGAWSDEDRLAAAALVSGDVELGRLYEFTAGSEIAKVIVEVGPVLALGLLTNGIYDALKLLLLRQGRSSRFEVHHESADGAITKAVVETDDPELLRAALESLDLRKTGTHGYDPDRRLWSDY